MRIEIDDDQDQVLIRIGALGIRDQVFIIDLVKAQSLIALKSRVLPPDLVHPGDQVGQVSRGGKVALLDFVFFRIEVFLAARLARFVFAKNERRSVQPIRGAERRGQNQARHKGGASPKLQVLWENIGSIRPETWAKVFADPGLSKFG